MKKSILGLILIVLSVCGMLYWELAGRDALMYTEVLTVNQNIEEGTVITREMLGLKKTTSPSLNSLRLHNAEEIIGKEAASYLPQGAELFSEYFEEERLVIHEDKGEFIFSLPADWLVSYPQTLRRGDSVTFLLMRNKYEEEYVPKGEPETGDEILTTTVLYVKSSSNSEVTSDSERLSEAASVSGIEIVSDKDQAQLLTRLAADGHKFVLLYQ